MSQFLNRIAGIALIIAGLAGLVFSVAGLVIVSRVEKDVLAAVTDTLNITDRALTATADGLVVANGSLSDARVTLNTVVTATGGFAKALTDTLPAMDSVTNLIGGELPTMLETTRDTLRNVAQNVKVLDKVIGGITSIPLLGLDSLKPSSELGPGFEQVADNLKDIPDQLRNVSKDVKHASTNLQSMSRVIDVVSVNISNIGGSLKNAQGVVVQYQGVLKDLQGQLKLIRAGLPTWLTYARWGLWALLIWLGIAQLGLLTQGWELMHRPQPVKQ